ncbi:DUF3347 domain-containing protein [Aequorivita todarodis]|uniref:DUF3347 domain-containing protein n=1 Tax=Aequorivita todarodis TaxID=2036821 RepID=UPI002350B1A6|nr:DUF3347 domain-containing protein [Aequorivita todarodis]MDC8000825.1 DUF3347 domain-containing protein [Aequorivita todarodis]
MKNVKMTLGILVITLVTLTVTSCNNGKKDHYGENYHSEMTNHGDHGDNSGMVNESKDDNMMIKGEKNQEHSKVMASYLELKNALVADDNEKAQNAGKTLMKDLQSFDTSKYSAEQQKELKDILMDATENAEHISKSPIKHQREHFKVLSKDMIDMVAITGTSTTLYQQFCPMYDEGSSWLSANKEVKNPYYGSKMLKCGRVEKEIN